MDNTSLIVNDLNKKKHKNIDLWTFTNVGEIQIDEPSIRPGDPEDYLRSLETAVATVAKVGSGPIVLIILELKKKKVALNCELFLKSIYTAAAAAATKTKSAAASSTNKLNYEKIIQQLNHIILSKKLKDGIPVYNLIGYVEKLPDDNPVIDRPKRVTAQPKACLSFKLQGTNGKCTFLPDLMKSIIYPCLEAHYLSIGQRIPQHIITYYAPRSNEDIGVMAIDSAEEEKEAEAEATQEVLEKDKCNFKKLARSTIKNNENYDYCKITDDELLLKIQENVNIAGLNGLINSRLDLKKLDDDKKVKEEELQNKEFSKRNATPVKGWNEMFMISKQVLLKNTGKTYSSRDFFEKYLNNDVLDVDKLFDEIKTEDIMS